MFSRPRVVLGASALFSKRDRKRPSSRVRLRVEPLEERELLSIDAPPIYQNPFMSVNNYSEIHFNAYQTDTTSQAGPASKPGQSAELKLFEPEPGLAGTLAFNSAGQMITIRGSASATPNEQALALLLIDPSTLTVISKTDLPPRHTSSGSFSFASGGYFYLDNLGRAVLVTANQQIRIYGLQNNQFVLVQTYDLAAAINNPADTLDSVLPDSSGNLWFVTQDADVGYVTSGTGAIQISSLKSVPGANPNETVTKSFATDESGGVFIVSDYALYRYQVGPSGTTQNTWRVAYDRGIRQKPGQVQQGSGTTPTAFNDFAGARFVTIADNADPYMHVNVYNRQTGALVAQQAVFSGFPNSNASENSLIAVNHSIIIENNFGNATPQSTLGALTTVPGVDRVDFDPSTGQSFVVWQNTSVAIPSVVSQLSTGDGLIYTYAKDQIGWYWAALDFQSGSVVAQSQIPSSSELGGVAANSFYSGIGIGPDGSAYTAVLGGFVAWRPGDAAFDRSPDSRTMFVGPGQLGNPIGAWYSTLNANESYDSERTHRYPNTSSIETLINAPTTAAAVDQTVIPGLPDGYTVVTRDRNELFVLYGVGDTSTSTAEQVAKGEATFGPMTAKIDANTLQVIWKKLLYNATANNAWNYAGGIGVQANGFLYTVVDDRAFKQDPNTGEILAMTLLPTPNTNGQTPEDTIYNGFIVMSDGRLVTKQVTRQADCTLQGLQALVDCADFTIPAYLTVLDPDTLKILSTTAAPQTALGRVTSSVFNGKQYVYLPGAEPTDKTAADPNDYTPSRVYRFIYDSSTGTLKLDPNFTPVAYVPFVGQKPGTAVAIMGDYGVVQTNYDIVAEHDLGITIFSQADGRVAAYTEPFAGYPSDTLLAQIAGSKSSQISLPTVDPELLQLFSWDSDKGRFAGLQFDPLAGTLRTMWNVRQESNAFANLVGTPDSREIVLTNQIYVLDPELFPGCSVINSNLGEFEQLVWRDSQTGRVLLRSPLQAGGFGAAIGVGFDGKFYTVTVKGSLVEQNVVRSPPSPIMATGPDKGGGPEVKVFDAVTGNMKFSFFAYDKNFTGGVRVAVGDVNGDGVADIICAPGPGGGPNITVYDGRTEQQLPGNLGSFFAYNPSFTGGVYVAAGDINGDGFDDIICGADSGGGPNITVFSGKDGKQLRSFFAYDPAFTGGVRVAAGDVNGDGIADIIAGAGPGGGPNVTVFGGLDGSLLASFFAYNPAFTDGIYVAAGDTNGNGTAKVICGAGAGGGPNITVFSIDGGVATPLLSFFAYDPAFAGGVRVASIDRNGNGKADIVAVHGPGGIPDVTSFNGLDGSLIDAFFAYDPLFTGGLFVAAGSR